MKTTIEDVFERYEHDTIRFHEYMNFKFYFIGKRYDNYLTVVYGGSRADIEDFEIRAGFDHSFGSLIDDSGWSIKEVDENHKVVFYFEN